MKILCSKENLNRAMNIVSRAIPVRTTMDIMRCVLLQAELDTLKLTANDMSLGIETTITAFVTEPGSVAIDASLFSAIVRKLPDSGRRSPARVFRSVALPTPLAPRMPIFCPRRTRREISISGLS